MNDKQRNDIAAIIDPVKKFILADKLYEIPDVDKMDAVDINKEHIRALRYHDETMTHMKNLYMVCYMLTNIKDSADVSTPRGAKIAKEVKGILDGLKDMKDAISAIDSKMFRILNFFERLR